MNQLLGPAGRKRMFSEMAETFNGALAKHLTPAGVRFVLLRRADELEKEAASLRRLAETEQDESGS